MISASDEYSLRTYATEILVQMLRSFNQTIEAEQALRKIAAPVMKVNDIDDDVISNSSREGDNFEKLQKARTEKSDYAKAAMKFNFKPKNGIAYLVA